MPTWRWSKPNERATLSALARERLLEARGELATALQLPPDTLPEVSGDLAHTGRRRSGLQPRPLLASTQAMPRLRALSSREEVARARVGLERADRFPDVTWV